MAKANCPQSSVTDSERIALNTLYAPAAKSVGTPSRNVNSIAGMRRSPMSSAMRIVAPERDVPGNTAASNWPKPTAIAIAQVTSAKFARSPIFFSTTTNSTPPTSSATATGSTVSGNSKPSLSMSSPPAPVMTNATSSLAK